MVLRPLAALGRCVRYVPVHTDFMAVVCGWVREVLVTTSIFAWLWRLIRFFGAVKNEL